MAFGFDPLPGTDGSGRHHPGPWPAGDTGFPGTVSWQVLLDGRINTAGISMQYNCGVLSLDLPVDPEHRTRKIPVRTR